MFADLAVENLPVRKTVLQYLVGDILKARISWDLMAEAVLQKLENSCNDEVEGFPSVGTDVDLEIGIARWAAKNTDFIDID